VEGRLFLYFIRTKGLLTIEDFLPVEIEISEYIGGLSDLTGELGRYAVVQASKRNYEAVHDILQVQLKLG
jgi:predicted translin family RNA/ssDNA-binding protein